METLKRALAAVEGDQTKGVELDKIITDIILEGSPIIGALKIVIIEGAGEYKWFMRARAGATYCGAEADPKVRASKYISQSKKLKIVKSPGSISDFLRSGAEQVDLYADEIITSAESISSLIEYGILYGNSVDIYQPDSLDNELTTWRYQVNAAPTLSLLDTMIDNVSERIAETDPKMFIMSSKMVTAISGLQLETYRVIEQVEFIGGRRVIGYRNIPIVITPMCSPRAKMTPVIISDTTETGGLVAGSTYSYRISAVCEEGEQQVSDPTTYTVPVGRSAAKLTWSPFEIVYGDYSSPALLYKIYRSPAGGGADSERLVVTISARDYDVEGNPLPLGSTREYIDKTPDAQLTDDIPLFTTNHENIFLVNLNERRGLFLAALKSIGATKFLAPQGTTVPFINFIETSRGRDVVSFLLSAFCSPVLKKERFSAIARGVKV